MASPSNAPSLPCRADEWSVHSDGSAMPNPGRMGLGAVLVAPDGTRHTLSEAAHGTGCNNEAEVRALMAALQALKARGVQAVRVCCDSSVVVTQLGAASAPPIARLAALFDEARGLLAGFERACVLWIPQHRNQEADALARAALGLTQPRTVKPHRKQRRS
ncbi:ribonuclease HI family protein [Variovorax ginsengisoli]|uniref:Ribonuclease HI n=1 Tax=Variovorax ginsengisoli TaxID=363844 RepID=A0ABT9SDR6_9BURK|nr:ribonuclease HI family protein [Variovorax ginsengisoli]MDP9901532.1 ribonuclease HI [Variovorax ginsengisoli]